MDYAIRFTGKISWDGQSNGLPPEIFAYLFFQDYNREVFNKAIEDQARSFVAMQAMTVQRNQGKVIDLKQMPQERMLVPFRWIVAISADVINLIGEVSLPDPDGTERLADGSEPVKQ